MKSINRDILKSRLIKEGYKEENGLEQTIDRLLALDGDASKMLSDWLNEEKIPEFDSIEGIDSRLLRNQLKMKDPAIILAYGMLLINPAINSIHLRRLLRGHMNYSMKNK